MIYWLYWWISVWKFVKVLDETEGGKSRGQQPLLNLHEGNALKWVHGQQTLITLKTHMWGHNWSNSHDDDDDEHVCDKGQCEWTITNPGEDREEAEGDGCSGGIWALGQRQLLWRRCLPLIGQKTEANEPQETGQTWRRETGLLHFF